MKCSLHPEVYEGLGNPWNAGPGLGVGQPHKHCPPCGIRVLLVIRVLLWWPAHLSFVQYITVLFWTSKIWDVKMPGMGKHVWGSDSLCPCSVLHVPLKSALIQSLFLLCCNFLMFIKLKGLERSEGMRKRFLFVNLGRCTVKWVHVDRSTTLAWSPQFCWANALEGAWALELLVWEGGQQQESKSVLKC